MNKFSTGWRMLMLRFIFWKLNEENKNLFLKETGAIVAQQLGRNPYI